MPPRSWKTPIYRCVDPSHYQSFPGEYYKSSCYWRHFFTVTTSVQEEPAFFEVWQSLDSYWQLFSILEVRWTSCLVRSLAEEAVRVRALAWDIVLCSWARHFIELLPAGFAVTTLLRVGIVLVRIDSRQFYSFWNLFICEHFWIFRFNIQGEIAFQ